MSKAALARAVGVSAPTVSDWESGKMRPKGQNLLALSAALGCEPRWLLTGDEKPPIKSNATLIGALEPRDEGGQSHKDEVAVPLYKDVELAAGNGAINRKDQSGGQFLHFPKSILENRGIALGSAVCATVHGDSMHPVLPDGAVVGINTDDKAIEDGQMYAINHDGTLRIAVLYRRPKDGIRLRNFNTNEYPDEMYDDDASEVVVIGRVFWYSVLK